jgi:hypothetical protein
LHAMQLLVKALPIEEGDYLKIVWPVTPSIHFYKEAPYHYLSHLIGHEGEGSIFHIIKELGKFISKVYCVHVIILLTLSTQRREPWCSGKAVAL